jgi:hypothetical protein
MQILLALEVGYLLGALDVCSGMENMSMRRKSVVNMLKD